MCAKWRYHSHAYRKLMYASRFVQARAQYVQKVFTLTSPKMHSMRAKDAKILDELEMLYGDKDCFYPLREWFGTAEVHWEILERLFMVADYAKKHNPSVAETITAYSARIVDLFHQTQDYASGWDSEQEERHRLSTEDYVEATDESWDALDKWTVTQEKLRCLILEFVEFLHSVVSES